VASYAVSLSADGEVSNLLKLEHLLKRTRSPYERERRDKKKDMDLLRAFIRKQRPHCIVIGVADRTALNIQR